ncbi:unnamed protein product [Peniophora sp. CBMAI 1063]|nr:unnamed protein product [Peniophora sp. CBMAI 1063]
MFIYEIFGAGVSCIVSNKVGRSDVVLMEYLAMQGGSGPIDAGCFADTSNFGCLPPLADDFGLARHRSSTGVPNQLVLRVVAYSRIKILDSRLRTGCTDALW